jgi:superfamily II DNA or RNA helicase
LIATDNPIEKELYAYQHQAIGQIFDRLSEHPQGYNLLYQLPTGGGKTVIFSEIARRYIREMGKKVLILTHRIELCGQTSDMLTGFRVKNKVIRSEVKEMPDQQEYMCFVAMVETLNNRLADDQFFEENIGLVIIDEAHYNSFGKLFKHFEDSTVLGVTATPLSSNIGLPMYDNYRELIVGNSIPELIRMGFLAKVTFQSYDVNLSSLTVGVNGDYTVSSSERLYSDQSMQEKLLAAYEEHSYGKKTLIFNNGIQTSKYVEAMFRKAKYDVRHLDNTNSASERKEIIQWFRDTPDAILTSVGILTTGFDEPTVESIILNRATRSLTLYFQMIGRGSRVLPNKDSFNVIDLGNNLARFGRWDEEIDWQHIFRSPEGYLQHVRSDEEIQRQFKYKMPKDVRARFDRSEDISFDVEEVHDAVIRQGLRPRVVIDRSIEQHARICMENCDSLETARELVRLLREDVEDRVRRYSYCISKCTDNYRSWLVDEYMRRLEAEVRTLWRVAVMSEDN